MATPNYGFEKRQKELAKKRKKEDKLKAKSDRKSGLVSDDGFDEASPENNDVAVQTLGPDATEGDAPASAV